MSSLLRVRAVDVSFLSVPTHDPFVIATGRVDATRSALIEITIESPDGRLATGLGEGAALPPVTVEDQRDVVQHLEERKSQLLQLTLPTGDDAALDAALDSMFPAQKVARAAAEMALLDALSRLDGVPVHERLSKTKRSRPGLVTDITLPILTPERMAELAQQWWKIGFRAFKVKVGKDLDSDLRAFEAIVKVVPGATFRPDANAGFSVAQSLKLAKEMERLGATLECFEQPCAREDLEGMAEVARALAAPVIADESVRSLDDARRVIAAKAGDGINLKIVKSGGLRGAYAIGALARASGMSLMVGGMVETRLGMTAAAHLSASLGGAEFPDLDTAWLLKTDPFDGGYASDGPRYTLPDAPGLGVTKKSGVSNVGERRQ